MHGSVFIGLLYSWSCYRIQWKLRLMNTKENARRKKENKEIINPSFVLKDFRQIH